jgi:hypothetical protein
MLCLSQAAASADVTRREVDPEAEELVRKFCEDLQAARTFSVEMHISTVVDNPNVGGAMDTVHTIVFQRPDKLALISKSTEYGNTLVSNGRQVYVDARSEGERGVTDAPDDDDLSGVFFTIGIEPRLGHGDLADEIVGALVSTDPYKKLTTCCHKLEYLGAEDSDGVECHELQCSLKLQGGWCLLISGGEAPRLLGVRQASYGEASSPNDKNEVFFKNWKLNIDVPADQFRIPPAGIAEAVARDNKEAAR